MTQEIKQQIVNRSKKLKKRCLSLVRLNTDGKGHEKTMCHEKRNKAKAIIPVSRSRCKQGNEPIIPMLTSELVMSEFTSSQFIDDTENQFNSSQRKYFILI